MVFPIAIHKDDESVYGVTVPDVQTVTTMATPSRMPFAIADLWCAARRGGVIHDAHAQCGRAPADEEFPQIRG